MTKAAQAGEKLGELLLMGGIVDERQLDDAMEVHRATGSPLGHVMVELGYASQTEILAVVARQMGLMFVDFSLRNPEPDAMSIVPRELATRYGVMPVCIDDEGCLVVAMADPQNVLALDDVRIATGREILPAIATHDDIVGAIDTFYKVAERLEDDALMSDLDMDLEDLKSITEEAPVVKLVNNIIARALSERASDIHIEPQEHDVRVRGRVDGVLSETMRLPKSSQQAVLSRFKIIADLDIAETRKPQDGHCALTVNGHSFDFRVSTLPTVYGERIVLRILRKDAIIMQLEDLGFLPTALEQYRSSFTKPYGCILVTGPTGSGKSTTLYATINVLNDPSRHILTAEDPVEYRVPGVNQVQTDPKSGLTFARALKSFLRCSPDIILVGEIRDRETAKTAVESALTGHLVLSTLHTNDAAGAVTRLSEMAVEPFLIASALDCVLAQRLARRLCPECKVSTHPSEKALVEVGFPEDDLPEEVFVAGGCKKCGGTGFRGRLGVHEVMLMTEEIRALAVTGATAEDIKLVAIEQGMLTLRNDGLEKVRMGTTSIEEIMRVVA